MTHKQAGGCTSAMCADLVPSERYDRSGRRLPALTKKNTRLYSLSAKHFFTQDELDFSQGWPALAEYCDGYEHCVEYDPSILSTHARQGLRGNGLHMAAIGTFLQYCMGFTVRRSKYTGFCIMPSPIKRLRTGKVCDHGGESDDDSNADNLE